MLLCGYFLSDASILSPDRSIALRFRSFRDLPARSQDAPGVSGPADFNACSPVLSTWLCAAMVQSHELFTRLFVLWCRGRNRLSFLFLALVAFSFFSDTFGEGVKGFRENVDGGRKGNEKKGERTRKR